MSDEIKEEYQLWRVWLEMKIPLNELKHKWTYSDLLKANDLLDMQADYKNVTDFCVNTPKDKGGLA